MNKVRILILTTCILLFFNIYGQESPDKKTDKTRKYIKYLDFRVENGTMLGNGQDMGDVLINQSYYNGVDIRLAFRN